MKTFLLSLCLSLCGFRAGAQPPKLYLYLVSHNEDNIGYLTLPQGRTNYLSARSVLVNVCNIVQAKGLAYCYGADWVALKAIARYDTGAATANTSGKNLVKWMVENKSVECDPHSHEATYNYGDVAYLMSQLGVTPSSVMSGYLYDQLQNGHSWEDYQNGAQGDSFSFYTWHPEIKWGAGSPNHVADLNMFGVYRPKSMVQFTVHEPANHLIFCGTGCPLKLTDTSTVMFNFSQIRKTAEDIRDGVLPANGIYMQEIFFSEGDIRQPWFLPLLNSLTDSLSTLVSAGLAEWKGIENIVAYWKAGFNNRPFAVKCDYTVVLNPLSVEASLRNSGLRVYPNPAGDRLEIRTIRELSFIVTIRDCLGRKIMEAPVENGYGILDISKLSPGMYILQAGGAALRFIRN